MKLLWSLLLVLIVAAGTGGYLASQRLAERYQGYRSPEQFIEIPAGASTRAIGARLIDAGLIRDELTFRLALWVSGTARRLQAGEYRFDQPMTARDVLEKIARGEVDRVEITFPEGLTVAEMARIVDAHRAGSADAFLRASRDPSAIRDLDPAARDLEGYLFPDTYAVSRTIDGASLVAMMVERFRTVMTPELRRAATDRGLTIRRLVTLASIVEKETGNGAERPLVAAVYANRLRINMPLQCDPTVIYALARAGRFDGNLRRDDLSYDSPYNTYRYPGLPPGPIAAPGRASLEAAAHPADARYLYFVSRNDGSHAFAESLAEHNRNVQRFQVQYFRRARQN